MIKTIQALDIDGNPTTLATFTLNGGDLTAEYHNAKFERWMTRDGIFVGGKRLLPGDGPAFFAGLDKEFANSSTVHVVSSGERTDFDDSEARAEDGKWTGGSSAPAVAIAEKHAAILQNAAETHDHPDVKEAAEKAKGFVEKAKAAAKTGDHAQAKEHAGKAVHEHHKLHTHAEHMAKEEGEEEEDKESGGTGHTWLDLLRLLGLKSPG